MTRHLITGSKGFLGQHLIAALYDDGVHGVDLPECDVTHAYEADCGSKLDTAIAQDKPSAVWHLAALNDATQTFYDRPWDVLNVQIRGTLNVIDACVTNGVKTLVLFSSSEVFQTPPAIPTPEAVAFSVPDPHNPRYSYAASKQAAEMLAWYSAIPRVCIIRPFNVYGPTQRPGHVIPDFVARAIETPDGGEFAINGSSTRSFIYIDDFIAGTLAAVARTEALPDERAREVFNVGTEEQVSTVALAGMISKSCGRERDGRYAYRFKTHPGPVGGTHARCPDTRKLRATGWEPRVPLETGLRWVSDYRRSVLKAKEGETVYDGTGFQPFPGAPIGTTWRAVTMGREQKK